MKAAAFVLTAIAVVLVEYTMYHLDHGHVNHLAGTAGLIAAVTGSIALGRATVRKAS